MSGRGVSPLVGQLLFILVVATAIPLGLSVAEAVRGRGEAERRAAENAGDARAPRR
jgi:hypothetical protein